MNRNESAQQPDRRVQTQSDDIVVVAFDPLDKSRRAALDRVCSGFVHRFAARHILADVLLRQRLECNSRGHSLNPESLIGRHKVVVPDHGNARDDAMGASAQAAQHGRRLFCVGRLAEDLFALSVADHDERVCAKNDIAQPAFRHRARFGQSKVAGNLLSRPALGEDLLHVTDCNLEVESDRPKQFAPARRRRGKRQSPRCQLSTRVRSHTAGATNRRLSNRSRTPPWPGMIEPKSFTLSSRFIADSYRSPT